MGDATDLVLLERAGAVATVTLNRPDRLNAMSLALVEQLRETLRSLAADADLRAVVLTGAGRGFCAGGDVSDLAGSGIDVEQPGGLARLLRSCSAIVEILIGMSQPVVAAMNGPAAGAGLSLACACDLRVLARGAVSTTAFVKVGQPGDYGLAWTLPRIVGSGRARDLLLTGRRIDADEALRIGLVDELADTADVLPRAQAIAAEIATRAPLAVAAIKASLHDAWHLPLDAFLDREAERFEANSRTDDALEAAMAFVEKRDPVFRGR